MHAALAAHCLAKCRTGTTYKLADFTLDTAVFHLLHSEQLQAVRDLLCSPALCEARVRSGHGQQLLADIETAAVLCQEERPNEALELLNHLEFLTAHYSKLVAGASWASLIVESDSSAPIELLRGIVSDAATMHSRIVRIFTSSTFDDLKV